MKEQKGNQCLLDYLVRRIVAMQVCFETAEKNGESKRKEDREMGEELPFSGLLATDIAL